MKKWIAHVELEVWPFIEVDGYCPPGVTPLDSNQELLGTLEFAVTVEAHTPEEARAIINQSQHVINIWNIREYVEEAAA